MLNLAGSKSLLLTSLLLLTQSTSVLSLPTPKAATSSSTTATMSTRSSSHKSADIKLVLDWSKTTRQKRQEGGSTLAPVINQNFPDPGLVHDKSGNWMAYATSGNGYHIQVATAKDPFGPWTVLDKDALPGKGWTSGSNYWAPDVRLLSDGTYIMYFSGQRPAGGHCIGTARSKTSDGPFVMDDGPLICPISEGGAIDPAGFYDEATGKRYIVYKVDGNAVGGETPIKLQEVNVDDGSTLIGDPVTIMNRILSEDGPLVEAPNLVKLHDGRYLLFFSSHMYTDDAYDVKYAVADSITGEYVRGPAPLLSSPALGLKGPGGGTSTEDPGTLVFHGYCNDGKSRCMYVIGYNIE